MNVDLNTSITDLSQTEVDEVSGGLIFIPIAVHAVSFGKGLAVGVALGAAGKLSELAFEKLVAK
ncbi:hypothetical protein [Rubrivivax sp. JA1026]|uniref:hypothetical protein n=1 Tax=Rubrivivax sp. JA1026 TaxID=2710888 RepID=UPI0013E97999|nr:hypothetical protein [Rubrivivax sp. JA1026]